MITVNVQVDLSDLRGLSRAITRGSPEMSTALQQSGQRVLTFTRRRFEANSRSGGNSEWPDLAPSTKIRRLSKTKAQRAKTARQAKQKGTTRRAVLEAAARSIKLQILVDTGILRSSLSILEIGPRNIRIGTAVNYARRHQFGEGVPVRQIVVPPSAETELAIAGDVGRAITRIAARLDQKKAK